MKKYLSYIILSIIIGFIMAYFLLMQYDNKQKVTISGNIETLYYIQRGAYSTFDNMKEGMKDFKNYIYSKEDNIYYAYIGITANKKNATKLQGFYEEKNYNTYIKEINTNNIEFVNIVKQYDKLIKKADDEKTIEVICKQILSKYEEYNK